VLGGDCTVELGTVAGASVESDSVGLVYVDLDVDLNTPDTTEDGALDWMGVAHILGLPGTVPAISGAGPRSPLLSADQIVLVAAGNTTAAERRVIRDHRITMVRLAKVAANPTRAAREVVEGWARRFDCLLIHLDVDVLDYLHNGNGVDLDEEPGVQTRDDVDRDGRRWVSRVPHRLEGGNTLVDAWPSTRRWTSARCSPGSPLALEDGRNVAERVAGLLAERGTDDLTVGVDTFGSLP
jgi:hypothetical protein